MTAGPGEIYPETCAVDRPEKGDLPAAKGPEDEDLGQADAQVRKIGRRLWCCPK